MKLKSGNLYKYKHNRFFDGAGTAWLISPGQGIDKNLTDDIYFNGIGKYKRRTVENGTIVLYIKSLTNINLDHPYEYIAYIVVLPSGQLACIFDLDFNDISKPKFKFIEIKTE